MIKIEVSIPELGPGGPFDLYCPVCGQMEEQPPLRGFKRHFRCECGIDIIIDAWEEDK